MSKSKDYDKVVCAFAERANGPGWANTPLWFVTRDGNGKLSMECLQPEEQTAEIALLYATSAAINAAMVDCVNKALDRKRVR